MRGRIVWQLAMVCILMAGCTTAPATKAGSAKTNLLHLKVDFAAPTGKNNPQPIPATAKQGWWHWVIPDWDFYRSDLTWEDGKGRYPQGGPGIAGSGVHAAVTCHYEGIMTIYVAGMRRYLAGGRQPEKEPIHEPICNTWIAASDFPNNPTSDLLLSLYDLPAGKYRLVSYHNNFNGRRIGDGPTRVEYAESKTPEPPMPSIRVYPIKTVLADYFKRAEDALVKGQTYGTPEDKMIVPGKQGTGNVRQTLEAKDVVIQQATRDAELKPSIIEFTTDGSPLVVVYSGGCCKSDDLRGHRKGGYAVLNAFELIQLGGVTTK
ncbi:MAG TPA: hypothetical protein VMX13_10100 [Sedimentisphaerales bacterium]|nr:hypothetical protein [Sedimentisphaerales bacterium]